MVADQLDVSTYVIVMEGCPLRFCVMGSGQVEVTCGEPRDGCQLLLDARALREFLAAGTAALAEMDACVRARKHRTGVASCMTMFRPSERATSVWNFGVLWTMPA